MVESRFSEIDPDLNVFALANGMDLFKDVDGGPDRTLEWYREGMERRIRLLRDDGADDRYSVVVEASRKREGRKWRARRPIRSGVPFDELRGELRSFLAGLIDEANDLDESELEPDR